VALTFGPKAGEGLAVEQAAMVDRCGAAANRQPTPDHRRISLGNLDRGAASLVGQQLPTATAAGTGEEAKPLVGNLIRTRLYVSIRNISARLLVRHRHSTAVSELGFRDVLDRAID
jgi:hypothetical protein